MSLFLLKYLDNQAAAENRFKLRFLNFVQTILVVHRCKRRYPLLRNYDCVIIDDLNGADLSIDALNTAFQTYVENNYPELEDL